MELEIPEYIEVALNKHPGAADAFHKLTDSQRKEYVEWVSDEQRIDDRQQRLQKMLVQLEKGKKSPNN